MITHTTKDGDMQRSICWKYYGNVKGAVEQVLQANRHLEKHDVILTAGIKILLPEISNQPNNTTIKLWS
jgi:phage tail protein X